ncbi:MAG: hydrogenase/urease maturation nickel metallochaperone HypA [Nitrospirota bacterium]
MHERAWVDALIRRVSATARGEGATRVVGVTVRVGPWSTVSADRVREHFAAAARGTIAEGARLTVNAIGDEAGAIDGTEVLESIEIET